MKKLFKTLFPVLLAVPLAVGCSSSSKTSTSSTSGTATPAKQNDSKTKETDYPKKPITMIVPYAAGGGTDMVARSLVAGAEKQLGQSIGVVNKTGGGGAVGMNDGAHAKPDGYTLTMVTVESTILPNLGQASFTYKDFKPIAMVNFDPSVLTVPADAPYKTLQDFIKYAKENPGKVRVGNGGAGGIWDLATGDMEKAGGVKLSHIPFDGGKPAVTALLGNHIEAVSISAPEVLPNVKSGQLKVLAVLSDKRLDTLPDVPTFKEAGIEAVPIGSWKGVAVPKDTPDNIVKILSDGFMKAADDKEFKSQMEKAALGLAVKDSKEFEKQMMESNDFFTKLIPELGLKK